MSKNKNKKHLEYNDYKVRNYRARAQLDLEIVKTGRSFEDCCAILNGDKGFFKVGRLNVFFGDGGSAKTTYITKQVIRFGTGQEYCGLIPNGFVPQIYIQTEQNRQETIHRYFADWIRENEGNEMYKRYVENVEIITTDELTIKSTGSDKRKAEITRKLKDVIHKFRSERQIADKPIMLTVDCAYAWFSDELSTNSLVERYIINPFLKLSKECNVSITLVCHTHRKPPSKPLHQNYLQGGHTLFNAADSVFGLDFYDPSDDDRTFYCFKGEEIGYTITITRNEKFFHSYELGACKYDCDRLRTLPPTKASALYTLLTQLFPNINEKNLRNIVRELVVKNILLKEKNKDIYKGVSYGIPPAVTISCAEEVFLDTIK